MEIRPDSRVLSTTKSTITFQTVPGYRGGKTTRWENIASNYSRWFPNEREALQYVTTQARYKIQRAQDQLDEFTSKLNLARLRLRELVVIQ